MFHLQHEACITGAMQFVDKEPSLAEPVLGQLLKFWPLTNSQKEVLFLGELEEILEMTQVGMSHASPTPFQAVVIRDFAVLSCLLLLQATEFAKIMVPLFKQVAKCLNSSHFQVRESPYPHNSKAVGWYMHRF